MGVHLMDGARPKGEDGGGLAACCFLPSREAPAFRACARRRRRDALQSGRGRVKQRGTRAASGAERSQLGRPWRADRMDWADAAEGTSLLITSKAPTCYLNQETSSSSSSSSSSSPQNFICVAQQGDRDLAFGNFLSPLLTPTIRPFLRHKNAASSRAVRLIQPQSSSHSTSTASPSSDPSSSRQPPYYYTDQPRSQWSRVKKWRDGEEASSSKKESWTNGSTQQMTNSSDNIFAGLDPLSFGKGKGKAQELSWEALEMMIQNLVEEIPEGQSRQSKKSELLAADKETGESTSVRRLMATQDAARARRRALDNRFDWRQTASSFRALNGALPQQLRQRPSPSQMEKLQSRSRELQSQINSYQTHLQKLVGLERKTEREAWDKLRDKPLPELIAQGWTIDGLVGYWQGGSTAKAKRSKKALEAGWPRTAVLSRDGLAKLGWSRFKQGDKVELMPSAETGLSVQDFVATQDLVLESLQTKQAPSRRAKKSNKKTSIEDDEQELRAQLDSDRSKLARITATVQSIDAYRMRLLFDATKSDFDIETCPSWKIDIAPNDTIHALVDRAIESLAYDVEALELADEDDQWGLSGTCLMQDLLPRDEDFPTELEKSGELESEFADNQLMKSWYSRYLRSNPLILDGDPDLKLNSSQLRAVATMLSSRLSLIQGPPGTGKTHTLVSTVRLLKKHFAVPHPVLLAAHTNVAVDNLAQGCISAGLKVVRVGPANGLTSGPLEAYTLEKQMQKHPDWPRLQELALKITKVKAKIASVAALNAAPQSDVDPASVEDTNYGPAEPPSAFLQTPPPLGREATQQIKNLQKALGIAAQQAYIVATRIRSSILHEADVICSTLIASSLSHLRCIDLPLVFLDESAQALESLSLLPIVKGARQVALIGDHKQLPPVLKSREAEEAGAAQSLFERLIEEDGWSSTILAATSGEVSSGDTARTTSGRRRRTAMQMLEVQHRMHPDLAEFPNERFYDGQLQSAPHTGGIGSIAHSFSAEDAPSPSRLVFVDHRGSESISKATSEVSIVNPSEAELIMTLVADLLLSNSPETLPTSSIGIITPYLGQSRLLNRLLRPSTQQEMQDPLRVSVERKLSSSSSPSATLRIAELEKIEVNTVDGFQGREKAVILFSAVRHRGDTPAVDFGGQVKRAAVGFLADARRLNVALTRARQACFVVGNVGTWQRAGIMSASQRYRLERREQREQEAEQVRREAGDAAAVDSTESSVVALASSATFSAPIYDGKVLGAFAEHCLSKGHVVSGAMVREKVSLEIELERKKRQREEEERIESMMGWSAEEEQWADVVANGGVDLNAGDAAAETTMLNESDLSALRSDTDGNDGGGNKDSIEAWSTPTSIPSSASPHSSSRDSISPPSAASPSFEDGQPGFSSSRTSPSSSSSSSTKSPSSNKGSPGDGSSSSSFGTAFS